MIASPQLWAQIVGAIFAGWVVSRWRLERTIIPIVYFMNLVIPLYAVMAWTRPSLPWIIAVVVIEQFSGGMGATAQTVYLMQRSRRAFSASHYAFATAVTAVGTTVFGLASGHLYRALGHRWYFVFSFVCGIPALILVLLVPKNPVDEPPPVAAARQE